MEIFQWILIIALMICVLMISFQTNQLYYDIRQERWRRSAEFQREARLRNTRYHHFRSRLRGVEKETVDLKFYLQNQPKTPEDQPRTPVKKKRRTRTCAKPKSRR